MTAIACLDHRMIHLGDDASGSRMLLVCSGERWPLGCQPDCRPGKPRADMAECPVCFPPIHAVKEKGRKASAHDVDV